MNQDKYEDDDDPYNEGGNWDPTADKPCVVPPFDIANTRNLTINGLDFRKSDDYKECVVHVTDGSFVDFHYCAFSQGTLVGLEAINLSRASAYNCYFYHNKLGVCAAYRSILNLIGENYVKDNLTCGITAFQSSTIVIKAWHVDAQKYITDIRTTQEVLKYSAIRLTMNSSIDVEDAWFEDDDINIAHVRIINETSFESPQYFGVVVESQSIFSGAENTSFADSSIRDGKVTIPSERQIVVQGTEGAVAVD